MAPHPGVGTEATPSESGADQVVTHALASLSGGPMHRVGPDQLRDQLLAEFERGLRQLRQERGAVHTPEDTHDTIRKVFGVREAFAAYAEAFAKGVKRVDGALEEELAEAVGATGRGTPTRSMDVPLLDGDTIRLDRVFAGGGRTVADSDQAIACLVELVRQEWQDQGLSPDWNAVSFAIACIDRLISDLLPSNGKKPMVTGVEALAVMLGHRGDDQMASVARGTIGNTKREYKKVKTERKSA